MDKAEEEHAKRADVLHADLDIIEKKVRAENADWKEEKRLKAALRHKRARCPAGRNKCGWIES